MPYYHYRYLKTLINRLTLSLHRLVIQVRAQRGTKQAKNRALRKARILLEDYYSMLLKYTVHSRVYRDLRGKTKHPSSEQMWVVRLQIDQKLEDFQGILNDVK